MGSPCSACACHILVVPTSLGKPRGWSEASRKWRRTPSRPRQAHLSSNAPCDPGLSGHGSELGSASAIRGE